MQNNSNPVAIFWHRRDLRLHDNTGLYHALESGLQVLPLFIFDTVILDKLDNMLDARVHFIYRHIEKLCRMYEEHGSSLLVKHGKPLEIFEALAASYNVKAVFTNHDYEPYALQRDKEVGDFLHRSDIEFHAFKDHVIFEKDEVVKTDGEPYTVYTPYMRRWKARFAENKPAIVHIQDRINALLPTQPFDIPALEDLGFKPVNLSFPVGDPDLAVIQNYHNDRDFPAKNGTTRLGVGLRFGTVSIREMVNLAAENNETWLNELIWREFFQMILHHFPQTAERSFKPAYDRIEWINDEKQFKAWCMGMTGFPIVDAGMRELSETGFMHNRVRMITASFLVKHLLIDWRWGEAWFAEKLLDYEQASNIGNWQWVAGSGCDAAPYFRVFNPQLQAKKFDPKGEYVRKWVPEATTKDYPKPIVDHAVARARALETYKKALQND